MSGAQRELAERIAAAPASWGICELPGWGYQIPVEQVLDDMRTLGLKHTELGPDGFIPGAPEQQAGLLGRYGLTALGAFVPVVLYDRANSPDPTIRAVLDAFEVLGAEMMVISADSGGTTYDNRPELDDDQWRTLIENLERAVDMAAERGVKACVHPHMGTMIQTPDEVQRVLASCEVPICLDTGHLTVGGTDPVALAKQAPERVAHVHFKDVDAELVAAVQSGQHDYTDAVRLGMYKPLGQGAVDLAEIVRTLEGAGYNGWYVPETDRVLAGEPSAENEPLEDMRTSVEFLRGLSRVSA